MNNIEVELRSFITEERYDQLLDFFKKNGEFVNEDFQESRYFDTGEDIRIQKNNFYSKLWMKKGKMHDEHREEIELRFDKDDIDKVEKIFNAAGHNVKIKWFRKWHTFKWQGVTVMVDYTKGYGYIIELEKMSSEAEKDKTLEELKQKLNQLGIPLTPREEFESRFKFYEENWRRLTGN